MFCSCNATKSKWVYFVNWDLYQIFSQKNFFIDLYEQCVNASYFGDFDNSYTDTFACIGMIRE